MEKQVFRFTAECTGQKFKALASSPGQMSAKFQIWCRNFGLSDAESLAIWVKDKSDKHITYFGNEDVWQMHYDSAIPKMPADTGVEIDISNV